MKNRFLFPLIIIVVLFIVGAIAASAVILIPSIIASPVIGLLFWYEEKNEVRKY